VTFSGVISNDQPTGTQGTLQIGAGTGNGTVVLTGSNTYTGGTTINNGATLALSGSGSIANSSAVTNNGTFDITASTNTVNLGGTYTQGASGALVMSGASGAMQKLQVAGAASLNGELDLVVASGSYTRGRYELISGASVTGQFTTFATNLSSYSSLLYALDYRSDGVYLVLGAPNRSNTLAALARSEASQQSMLTAQAAQTANALNYDCALFGPAGICLSFNARTSSADGNASGAGVLVGAYRLTPSVRIGAFIDQQIASSEPHGIKNNDPLPTVGGFIGYSQDGSRAGWQGKLAAAFSAGRVTITRDATLSNTEPGSGEARIGAVSVSGELGYGVTLSNSMIATPFLGLRYTEAWRGGYAERAVTDVVDYPLSFNRYAQRTTTASLGVRLDGKLTDALSWRLGLSAEYDLNAHTSDLTGGGLVGAGPAPAYVLEGPSNFALAPGGGRNRLHPVLDAGLSYTPAPNQAFTTSVGIRDRSHNGGLSVNMMAGYRVSF